jgi:hypothetical protein
MSFTAIDVSGIIRRAHERKQRFFKKIIIET